jgi:RNA ligase (TIGR02306 family)
MTERKLASIQKIVSISPIEGADAIEVARVLNWDIVVKKGEFSVGALATYFEIDSWVPDALAPFLSKGKIPREYNGVPGERLKTIRLRGQISQGLLLPLSVCVDKAGCWSPLSEGDDVTEWLGIQKWEAPVSAQLAGMARGNFPSVIMKTDAERYQNLPKDIENWRTAGVQFEVSMKLDGSSFTIANIDGEVVVCSRNINLKLDQEGNLFVDTAKKLGLIEKMANYPNIAIQGEIMGPGVQKNQEKLTEHQLFVFEAQQVGQMKYLSTDERYALVTELGLLHAPILHKAVTLDELGADFQQIATGLSIVAPMREGVVFKSLDGRIKFKAISNQWLLKNE